PIDYAILNQLSTDFNTRFVAQTESYAEQTFWSQYLVQTDEPTQSGTTIVEVPKELPKVSMVNSCLKKLKFYLASFDIVVKERTTATAITEGMWGFKHSKACFHDDIIPFVKNFKELFTSFDQCLIDEVTEVQKIFTQMELARDTVSSSESAPTFAELFEINELKAQIQEKDTVILKLKEKLKSFSGDVKERKVERDVEEIEILNLELDHKVIKLAAENNHLKQTYKQLFNSIKSSRVQSKEQCDDLINKVNLKSVEVADLNASLQEKVLVERDVEEIETLNLELDHKVTKLAAENNHLKQTYKQLFDSIKSSRVQSKEQCDDLINKVNLKSVEVADLNASLQEKVLVITALKEQLKGKKVLTEAVSLNPIDPALLQVDVAPLVLKLRKNRTAHIDYIR
nr:hypothetical protein [Tanacetum cinerariifolium]